MEGRLCPFARTTYFGKLGPEMMHVGRAQEGEEEYVMGLLGTDRTSLNTGASCTPPFLFMCRVWDLETGDPKASLDKQPMPISCFAVSPDGESVVFCSGESTIRCVLCMLLNHCSCSCVGNPDPASQPCKRKHHHPIPKPHPNFSIFPTP